MADPSTSRKAAVVLLASLAGAGLGYLSLLLIGRYVAPAAYGAYIFALSATGLLALLSNLGLGPAHQRHVAQGVPLDRALGVLVRIRLGLGTALLLLFALGYAAWSAARGRPLTDATTPALLGLAVALHVISGVRQVLLDTWQGQQRVHRVEAVKTADTLLGVLFLANLALLLAHLQGRWEVVPGVGAAWARLLGLDGPPGPEQAALLVAACFLVPKALTLAGAWAWSWRDRVSLGPWDGALARSYLAFAFPLAASGALVLVVQYTDTLMLGYFWTAREVGLYGSAQRLASFCLLGATAVGAVLFPRFASLHALGDRAAQDLTFDRAERYLLLLTAPVAAAMVALPREGLHIAVGDAYLEAAVPLRLLALWALVTATAMPLGSRFMGEARTRLLVRSAGLNAGLNVLLNLALIPEWGAGMGPEGAALATLVSTSVFYVYLRWEGRRHHGLSWVDRHQVRILAVGALVGLGWWAAARWAGPAAFDRAWELAGWGAAGLAVYAAALAAAGELKARDLAFARRILHPRELLREMRGR